MQQVEAGAPGGATLGTELGVGGQHWDSCRELPARLGPSQ